MHALGADRGVVALGDSIINGHNTSMSGVPARSWAQWIADVLEAPYLRFGRGGAPSSVVVSDLLPKIDGRFGLGLVSVGTNDGLGGLDSRALEENLDVILSRLTSICGRVLILSIPTSTEATRVIRLVAARHSVDVIDGRVTGRRLLRPDGIHPTALGHLAIADRAAAHLGIPLPSTIAVGDVNGPLGLAWWVGHASTRAQQKARKVRLIATMAVDRAAKIRLPRGR